MRAWFAVITYANTVAAFKYSVWKQLYGHSENCVLQAGSRNKIICLIYRKKVWKNKPQTNNYKKPNKPHQNKKKQALRKLYENIWTALDPAGVITRDYNPFFPPLISSSSALVCLPRSCMQSTMRISCIKDWMSNCMLQGTVGCELSLLILKIPLLYVILLVVLIRPTCIICMLNPFYEKWRVGFSTNIFSRTRYFLLVYELKDAVSSQSSKVLLLMNAQCIMILKFWRAEMLFLPPMFSIEGIIFNTVSSKPSASTS